MTSADVDLSKRYEMHVVAMSSRAAYERAVPALKKNEYTVVSVHEVTKEAEPDLVDGAVLVSVVKELRDDRLITDEGLMAVAGPQFKRVFGEKYYFGSLIIRGELYASALDEFRATEAARQSGP